VTSVGVMASAVVSAPWTPLNLTGLQLWLDAADTATITHSAGAVSQWNDKGPAARHHVQATSTAKPTTGTRTINGRNALDFDGTSDRLTYTWPGAQAQPITAAVVIQTDTLSSSGGGVGRIYGRGNTPAAQWDLFRVSANAGIGAGVQMSFGPMTTTSPALIVGIYKGATSRLRLDRASSPATSIGTLGIEAALYAIGANTAASLFFDGLIAELIIAAADLEGTADLTNLETYLRDKWATP
jgi:hypothetical protein